MCGRALVTDKDALSEIKAAVAKIKANLKPKWHGRIV